MMTNEELLNEMIRAYQEEQKYFRRTIASVVLFVLAISAIIRFFALLLWSIQCLKFGIGLN